jgi:RNA polymerase sigma-70 factor (ECF subfamily)
MSSSHEQPSEPPRDGPDELDLDKFVALYAEAHPRLHLIATGIVGDRIQAEDLVQEAAMIALQKRSQFTTGTNFAAWVAEIVRRCAWNYARKQRGRKTIVSDPQLLEETNTTPSEAPRPWPLDPQSGILRTDQAHFDDELMAALATIQPDARCCLLLRVVEGLSYAEISALLDMPEGTAMSHVHRSKQTIRAHLNHHPKSSP